jgi:uncharacterized membrane protein
MLSSRAGRALASVAALIVAGTVTGLIALWPGEEVGGSLLGGIAGATEGAEVLSVQTSQCPPPQPGECGAAEIRIESGPDAGDTVELPLQGTLSDPDLSPGDQIRATPAQSLEQPDAPNLAPATQPPAYSFADFERRAPMLWLAVAFAALVVVFGRLRGALSLIGLAASLAVVLLFIVPAILAGEPPLAVSVTGALAVMLLTISLAHGWNPKSLAAILGTTASLLLVAALAAAFSELTNLTGLSSEEATLLQVEGLEVDFQGLLLAGMVIGALGVLDDVTVSQASTVIALRRANPSLGLGSLYNRAIEVGRDHVSATVNTLVLAYVGASLPILLVFSAGSAGLLETLNVELVSKEVVATLVGSIGLIAAVPITTLLTAVLCRGLAEDALGAEVAGAHAH